MKSGRLPQLKKLKPNDNTQTHHVKYLVGDSDVKLTCVEEFSFQCTDLSAADLQVLAEAVKLPQLNELQHIRTVKHPLLEVRSGPNYQTPTVFAGINKGSPDRYISLIKELQKLSSETTCRSESPGCHPGYIQTFV